MIDYKPKQRRGKAVKHNHKTIGRIVGHVFEVRRRRSRHLLRSVPGWAFSRDVLETLNEEGVETIQIFDADTNILYAATLLDFQKAGVPINYYGDPQLCLPLSAWKVVSRTHDVRT